MCPLPHSGRNLKEPVRMRNRCALWTVLLGTALSVSGSWADSVEQAKIDFPDGLFRVGLDEEAAEEYRAYLEEFPDGQYVATALYRLGECEYALQRYEAALEVFDQVLAKGVEEGGDTRAVEAVLPGMLETN